MYALTPATEIHARIATLQAGLRAAHLDAAFLVQNADLFYFTGSIQQGILIVPAEGEPVYFVRRVFERAVEESPLPNVRKIGSPKEVTAYFAEKNVTFAAIGFELDVLPVGTFLRFQQVFPGAKPEDVSMIVREIRAAKSPHEADPLRENGRKLAALLSGARKKIRPGVTEVALQGMLQGEAIGGGHSTINRMRAFNQDPGLGCVISGPDAAVPSYADFPTAGKGLSPFVPAGQGERAIQANEPLIIDLMWAQDGYLVDMARTYSVGPMPAKMEQAYNHAVAVLRTIEAGAATPYAENFMGPPGYNTKFIGHGIGIEVDEFPFVAKGAPTVLAPGMVIALEPKFVFPGEGAVGLENTYLVTADGFETLTPLDEGVLRCGG